MNASVRTVMRWFSRGAAAAAVVLTGSAFADAKPMGDIYPLDTCPVSGEKLSTMGKPVTLDYQGREIRFCCEGCKPKFEKDAAKYIAKIDEAITKQQGMTYPVTTCPVSGKPVADASVVYNNRLVKFCCKDCVKDFQADPAKYLAKLDQAIIDKEKASYPLKTCVVSGEALEDGKTVDVVTGNRLVRFCCKGCVKDFNADPQKYLSKLDNPGKAEPKAAPAEGSHK